MDQQTLKDILKQLINLPKETEWLEFKEAKEGFSFEKLGEYFSALSNEANLKNKDYAWLVFGIRDNDRKIVGTHYRNRADLDRLKPEIADHTSNRITFIEIHELLLTEGRVIMFQIPPAPKGIPVCWKGHYYGREGESLNALSLREIESIRNQSNKFDWSAQICKNATIDNLDYQAIVKARTEYKKKNPLLSEQSDLWDNITFLNKAKITIEGKITNTAIILLGKEESEHFISPSVAKITWILKDSNNNEKDYEHFGPPFILNADKIFAKIRNLKYRYLPNETLFTTEVNQYDPWVIREALHNCIAHQNYELKGKINLVENPDELIFVNAGNFMPGSVDTVIKQDSPPEIYRNSFLTNAMVNLNMIDTIGSGIKKMFQTQMGRFFPLPDYDLTQHEKVFVKIQGRILNENYTRLLINYPDMDLSVAMLLDKVQKNMRISKDEHKYLKSKNLIEGRYPNLLVATHVTTAALDKVRYIKNKGFDDKYYKDLILEYLRKNGAAARNDIDELLLNKLPDVLDEKQKRNKVRNILYNLAHRQNTIKNIGSSRRPKWTLM